MKSDCFLTYCLCGSTGQFKRSRKQKSWPLSKMSVNLPYSFRIPISTPMGTLPLTKDSRFPLIEFNSSFDSGIPFKRWGIWKESPKKHQGNQRCNFISPHSESPRQRNWKSPGPPQTSPFKIRHHTVAAWVEFLESLDLVDLLVVVDLLENTRIGRYSESRLLLSNGYVTECVCCPYANANPSGANGCCFAHVSI